MKRICFGKSVLIFFVALVVVSMFFEMSYAQKKNAKDLTPSNNELPEMNDPKQPAIDGLYQPYLKPEASVDGYIYDPVGRRDPFRPYRDAKVGIGQLVMQRERSLEALENFDVKTLEVVAIIWGISKPKALIQDPNKVIHTVVKGMRIGRNDGVVAEIREGEVVVVELFDQNGKIMKEPFILSIKK